MSSLSARFRVFMSITFLTIGGWLASCSQETETPVIDETVAQLPEDARMIEIESGLSVYVPDYLEKDPETNESYVQYSRKSKERYLEIHAISKKQGASSDLKQFSEARLTPFRNTSSVLKEKHLTDEDVNGMPAILTAFDVQMYGTSQPLAYWVAFLEGKEHFYEVKIWTLADRKSYFEEEVNAILYSCKEH